MSSITGPGLYRGALAYEMFANVACLPLLLFYPDKALSFLVKSPAQITPATRSLTQWFGGIVLAFTVPLVLSWKNPSPGPEGQRQIGVRRAAYMILGSGEVALSAVFAAQYFLNSDSGITNVALVVGADMLISLLGMRYFFLAVKPHWLEGREDKSKSN